MKAKITSVELPVVEPVYCTYQYQGIGSAVISENPSIRNWYLNHPMVLQCGTRFLSGYTSPELKIADSEWNCNPYILKYAEGMRFLGGSVNSVIRNMLSDGYYVYYKGLDDYYIQGKSFYKKRHFPHDGLICGFDSKDKTYTLYAYNENWIYTKFKTPQRCFEDARRAMLKTEKYGTVFAVTPNKTEVKFNPREALDNIKVYIDPLISPRPLNDNGKAYGIMVQDYICRYIEMLSEEKIPYEKMDFRILRLIWEHKKVMLERIEAIEKTLSLKNSVSQKYEQLVKEADYIRMLYASYHMKRRDSLLPVICKKLKDIRKKEEIYLKELIREADKKCSFGTI